MSSIDFENLVSKEFKFFEENYGFCCVETSSDLVRYESNDVFVVIRYDVNRSYELGVEIGQRKAIHNEQERPFSLNEILRLHKSKEASIHSATQVSSKKAAANFINMMASQLSQYSYKP